MTKPLTEATTSGQLHTACKPFLDNTLQSPIMYIMFN